MAGQSQNNLIFFPSAKMSDELELQAGWAQLKAARLRLEADRSEFKAEQRIWEATKGRGGGGGSSDRDLEAAKAKVEAERLQLETEKSRLRVAQAQLGAAQSQLELAHAQLNEARAELETARRHLEAAKAQTDINNARLEAAKASLEASKLRFEAATEQLNAAKSMFEEAKSQLETATSAITSLALLEEENARLRLQICQLQSEISKLQTTIRQLENDKRKLEEGEMKKAREEIQRLETENSKLRGANCQLENDKRRLEGELKHLKVDLEQLKNNYKSARDEIEKLEEKLKPQFVRNPKVFLDITYWQQKICRVVIELYDDTTPRSAENFRAFCTGEKGFGSKGRRLHYKGSFINRVNRVDPYQGFILGGMLKATERIEYDDGESIYGGNMPVENFIRKHTGPGDVTMEAVSDGIVHGNIFLITAGKNTGSDGKNVVIGKVVEGMDFVLDLVSQGSPDTETYVPDSACVIKDCGQLS